MDQQNQASNIEEAPRPPVVEVPAVKHEATAGQLILGWLTYALWGWTVLALSILLTTVIANLVSGADTSSFTPYGIAAVIVLLPIAAVCDYFYSKHEQNKKTGGSLIIMVIHAVIFAIFCIGSLIGMVFSIVQLFTSASNTSATMTALYSTSITAILYGAAFVRTLNPTKPRFIKKAFMVFMIIVTMVVVVLAIIGPVSYERSTRDDRLISENISYLQQAIDTYASDNGNLPAQLSDLQTTGDATKLIKNGLVRYTAHTQAATSRSLSYSSGTTKTFYYEFCVDYKKRSGTSYDSNADYTSYISAYSHPAGEVCYKLKTSAY